MALRGTLADLGIIDLIQFPHSGRKTGQLIITSGGDQATLFYGNGSLIHAVLGERSGMEALVNIVDWNEGEFEFVGGSIPEEKTIDLDLHRAVMQALKLHDELKQAEIDRKKEASRTANGITGEKYENALTDFVNSTDFAMYACVLDDSGNITAAAAGKSGVPEKSDEIRLLLHWFVQSHPRKSLSRVIFVDDSGTVVFVRLDSGDGVLVIANKSASLGSVSMGIVRLAATLEQT